MTPLRHIVEPQSLMLTWQPVDEQSPNRTRRVVALISRRSDGTAAFRYLVNSIDYQTATTSGFKGYPSFRLQDQEINLGVMETLLRRLPPRNREDFPDFLALHRLPSPFIHSDFALLGYTGARLPSDGFSLIPRFDPAVAPCDYILEVAGFRHESNASVASIATGDQVHFVPEPHNPHDPHAIAITHHSRRIGYVNRALCETFNSWLKLRSVNATIERINGKPERPLVYVRVEITC